MRPIWGVVVDNTDIRLDSPKGNAINLSADVLDFVVRRNQYERPIGQGQRLCPFADIVTDRRLDSVVTLDRGGCHQRRWVAHANTLVGFSPRVERH